MESLTVFVALTWMVTTVLISSQAAPVTEFFGPPQTIEGDSNVDYHNIDPPKKVKEMERFHRTYKNGTVEFKMALSNGHVQYQRISSKVVDGDKVQVYEGYISEQYKDGRYGTRYYAADENGYRSSSVIIENEPPQLPTSGPYSSSLPRNIQNELSPLNDDNTQTKPKTLIDNLVELENVLEEEQLSNLNLGSNTANENSIPTTESEILKHLENEEISEKSIEEEAITQNFKGLQTELPLNLDLPLSTELPSISESENNVSKVSEEPKSSTLPALGESSSIGIAVESSTNQPINEANNGADNFEESSGLPTQSSEEELLIGRSLHPSTTSEILSEVVEDVRVPYEERIDEVTSTVPETSFNNEVQEPSTSVPEILIDELKTDNEISIPQEDDESHSATLSPADGSLNSSDEIVKALTEQPSSEVIEDRSTENTASAETEPNSNLPISSLAPENEDKSTEMNEFPTEKLNNGEVKTEDSVVLREDERREKAFEAVSEAITGTILNDEVTLTEQPVILKNEDQEPSTENPESNELKTEAETSTISTLPLEDTGSESTTLSTSDHISKSSAEEEEVTKVPTEQSSLEIIDNTTTERISSENESNSDLSSSSISPEIKNEVSMDLPLEEDSTSVDEEASKEVPNEPETIDMNEKNGRSIDFSTELPLPEINSTTSSIEGSGSEKENNISDSSIISEIDEETTNKIERNTEQPESNENVNIVTTAANEINSADAITEEEVVLSTQKNNGLEAVSSESNNDNTTETNSIIPALTSSEENSSEENNDKSTEDDSSTELPDESIEEKHNTASIIEYSTEAEVLSTTEETEAKTSGAEVEFYPPVIHF